MSVNLEPIRAQVNILLGFADFVSFTQNDRDEIIRKALDDYSGRKPILQVEEMTANATGMYTLPSNYEDGFSKVVEVEYPVALMPKEIVEDQYWDLDKIPSGRVLRFDQFNPTNGDTFWLKFTKKHEFDSSGDASEVPQMDQTGIEFCAAYLCCHRLATFFASKANPNLPEAQVFEYSTRTDEYTRKAKDFKALYDDQVKPYITGLVGNVRFLRDYFVERRKE